MHLSHQTKIVDSLTFDNVLSPSTTTTAACSIPAWNDRRRLQAPWNLQNVWRRPWSQYKLQGFA
jgi:hypothetical protein